MKNRRKQRRVRAHGFRWGIIFALSTVVIIGAGLAFGAETLVARWTADLPSIDDTDAFTYAEKSTVYASDESTVLAVFQLDEREPLKSLGEISDYVINGTIATEDSRFYEHNGVDMKGIARAAVKTLMGTREGASTITQQLVRNTLLASEMNEISLKRKVREMTLALEMEQKYSKDEILLMYLNTINYGDGCYGIGAAARHYFSVPASDLTLEQSAALVGIPQSPNALNPAQHPEACQTRRNIVLGRMADSGVVSPDSAAEAKAADLELNMPEEDNVSGLYEYPYFTAYVRDTLLEQFSTDMVYEGGLQIYTTIDADLQKAADEACERQNASMSSELESALIAIEPTTGFIKCMVGGRDFYEDQFNIATQKGRPTGSSFKMFTLVTALEQGISPGSTVDCSSPMTFPDGVRFENINNVNYGTQTIQGATAVSANTGYIRLQQEVGTKEVIETARKMGVSEYLPVVTSLTLGVADVTLEHMASAYGVLAADGKYFAPKAVSKIYDSKGELLYDAIEEDKGEQVISPEVAYAATRVLQTVFSSGTATDARPSTGAVVAGKTGTTENYLDHWLVGYTTYLSCAAWIGSRYNDYADSYLTANNLWRTFMEAATAGKPITQFAQHPDPAYNHKFSSSWAAAASGGNSASGSAVDAAGDDSGTDAADAGGSAGDAEG